MNKIIFIGNFTGGSFGLPGDPSKTFPYYALQSDIDTESQSHECSRLVAFRIKQDAQARLDSLKQRAADEIATATNVRSVRQVKLALGRNIRAAIEHHTGQAVHTLRWSEASRPVATLSKKLAALLRGCPAGGCDAVADGKSFRVWIGSSGLAVHIVELSAV
ncbi:hypothetical protein [Limnoglobus roseus]|uniref:Uncharacterized protein n=1 Tax=Limnoglobus roseus TaxID=2598579 RepID=A0A5C1AGT3_9BACT|nr:hypothetical protein [Limnoglobus roseus]QEL17453.1 hypothetical protein PX52LOC_04442 [Limnoglobus roseus]